jgi:choice-of-anchor A domain-containing protein
MYDFQGCGIGAAVVVCGLGLGFAPAMAAPISAENVLQQFDAIVLGNMTVNQNVGGRTLVEGNVIGNGGSFYTEPSGLPASDFDALIVGGNLVGGWMNVNNGGNVTVGGNARNVNMNGHGTLTVGGNYNGAFNQGTLHQNATVSTPHVDDLLHDFSDVLFNTVGNSGITLTGSRATFVSLPDANGVAVFTIDDGRDFFSHISELSFVANGASSILVNVGGNNLDLAFNFLGSDLKSLADNIIWNFHDANNLTLERQFFGTVLAPDANVSNSNEVWGTLVAKDLKLDGQLGAVPFSGSFASLTGGGDETTAPTANDPAPAQRIDEPATNALFATGLAAMLFAALRRRRQRAH